MRLSLGNPTPRANEGGIYHPRRRGRCREEGWGGGGLNDPSAWEQLTLFLVIVREKCDSARGGKALCSGTTTQKKNNHHLSNKKVLLTVLWKSSKFWWNGSPAQRQAGKTNSALAVFC